MDKNMINIDDLVRQRLSGGEEKERVGAWTNMKALLDQEMPPEPIAVGWNWRRIGGYFTGLLLLAALSVGGYKGYEIVKENNLNKNSSNDASEHTNGNPVASREHAGNDTHVSVNDIEQAVNNNTKDNTVAGATMTDSRAKTVAENGAATTVAHHNTKNHQMGGSHASADGQNNHSSNNNNNNETPANSVAATTNHNSHSASANTSRTTTAANNNSTSTNNNGTAATANNNAATNANGSEGNDAAQKLASNQHKTVTIASGNAATNNSGNIKHAPEAPVAKNTANNQPVNSQTNANNAGTIIPQAAVTTVAGNSGNNGINPAGTAAVITNNNTNMLRDTLKKIKILQRFVRDNATHALSMRIDTIAVGQQIVLTQRMTAQQQPANNNTVAPTPQMPKVTTPTANNAIAKNTARKSSAPAAAPATTPAAAAPTPAPAAATAADDNSMLVPLANYKVSSHKSYAWDPERFQDMVRRAKFSMSQIKFYPGVTGGLNASFGSYSLMGFQFGLSGVVAINDHWSILTELKYINRSNKGLSINDNYVNTTGVDSIGRYHGNQFYKVYTRTDDSVQHYFNFSILHSVELPISVRYAIGRLYVMGGINLVYNFGVNTEEIDQHYTVKKTLDSTIYSNFLPISTVNGKAKITTNDFASRFGLGYLVGLGYQITPAVQLDVRMTRTFWDNASSQGAKDVSNQLYKMPSFQLSVGYRFSQKK
ncbi:porin family protein [Taibaiella soli]|uniref:Outer membrane protein beta-barrel domain-containing protein n=1 Tax=Taibaiella soli TaxID=1649169 RepID=A0A2W2BG63_9BACT|nr:outer membrane beta-barrel protein [Taibaiella soli]PZF74897.1 hypothetical protein DN068_01495 [Taibaiella soli]